VYDTNGSLLGVISAGVRFDTDQAVDDLKKLTKSDVTVFRGDTRIATTIRV
jgi:methyl-accepting chemotaxis protein